MLKKSLYVVAVVMFVAVGSASATASDLPPVNLSEGCVFYNNANTQAAALIDLLKMFITDMPDYATMDLENGLAGDGIPDSWQFALLGSALCAGDPALIDQLHTNQALFDQFATDLGGVIHLILGPPQLAVRLQSLADILSAHPELMADPQVAAVQASIVELVAQINDLLGGLDSTILGIAQQIPTILPQYKDLVVMLVGLNSEMQAPVTNLLAQYRPDIDEIIGQVDGVVAAFQTALPLLTTQEQATVNGMITDTLALRAVALRILALPGNIAIYGSFDLNNDQPFSASGDYDGDGKTNLAVFDGTKDLPGGKDIFVSGASGATPFWPGNTGLPVAGLLGFAAMVGAMAMGGTHVIRRKK